MSGAPPYSAVVDALAEAPKGLRVTADIRRAFRRCADSSSCSSALHCLDDPFADLQRDVAGEAVADDDVGFAGVDVAALDVADESHRRRLEQLVRLARQLVALALFFADRQQPDARRLDTRARRARMPTPSPRTARRCCGRHSTVAPESSSTAGLRARRESSSPAPDDRRRAAARTPRARPSPPRRCARR